MVSELKLDLFHSTYSYGQSAKVWFFHLVPVVLDMQSRGR